MLNLTGLAAQFGRHIQLQSIILSYGLKSIGRSAFRGYTSLENISLPDSVVEIGERAFENCRIKSITIPDSVTYIADHAFDFSTTIKCTENSTADTYAHENGYIVEYLNEEGADTQIIEWELRDSTLIISGEGMIPNDYHPYTVFMHVPFCATNRRRKLFLHKGLRPLANNGLWAL